MSQLQPIHAAAGRKRIRRSLAPLARLRLLIVSSLLVPLVLVSVSCATKGFVRKTVAPVDHCLGEVEQSSNRNLSSIAELGTQDKALQRDIERADERAGGAEGKALDAGQLATERAARPKTHDRLPTTPLAGSMTSKVLSVSLTTSGPASNVPLRLISIAAN